MKKNTVIIEEDEYVNDDTNIQVDDDYFDPIEDSDERDFLGLMEHDEAQAETCEWGDLY